MKLHDFTAYRGTLDVVGFRNNRISHMRDDRRVCCAATDGMKMISFRYFWYVKIFALLVRSYESIMLLPACNHINYSTLHSFTTTNTHKANEERGRSTAKR